MQRLYREPRLDWVERVEELGFSFHSMGGSYWDESVYYQFTIQEIEMFEAVTNELQTMCRAAIDHIIQHNRFEQMGVPPQFLAWVTESWQRRDPSLYGRFDFSYNGSGPPRLLEYNADTPTSLFETSVVQWFWLQDVFPDYDQFNRVHEMLLAQWKRIRKQRIANDVLTLTCTGGYEEDVVTTQYLRDVAMQAGCRTQFLDVGRIGWDDEHRCFVDEEEQPITSMFKLYPWEWLFDEEFGDYLLVNPFRCIVEPPWKALLSCKALLPVLWELYPNHPNLLPASFEPGDMQGAYVSKPIFGREGQGVIIYDGDQRIESLVQETTMPRIYQAYAPLTLFGERYPMIGSWVVGERAAGIGIREAPTLITDNEAFFAPHCIEA